MPVCLVSSGNITALALRNSCSDLSEFTGTVGLCGMWMHTSLTRFEKLKFLQKCGLTVYIVNGQVRLLQHGHQRLSLKCKYERDWGDFRFSVLVAWALL